MYSWKGNFEKEEEYIVLLKIRSADFLMVAKAIARNHPYEVPCIVKYDIAAGFQPYLDWIMESTDRSLEG
jgi:periplasmic divalent cation tolerance protein